VENATAQSSETGDTASMGEEQVTGTARRPITVAFPAIIPIRRNLNL
jgi:hypothetical protein